MTTPIPRVAAGDCIRFDIPASPRRVEELRRLEEIVNKNLVNEKIVKVEDVRPRSRTV